MLGRLPDVTVEGALAPEAASGGWEEELAVGAVEVDLGFEHPSEGRGNGDDVAGVGLAVVGLGALEDLALVGGPSDLEGLAVEVFGAQRENLAEAHAGVGEGPHQCLVAARCLGEVVHLLEGEDAYGPRLLLRPWVVGPDANSLEGVEVADFVGDRVLGHCREGAENANGAGGGSTFVREHVVDQGEGVATAQLVHRPVLQGDALDLVTRETRCS